MGTETAAKKIAILGGGPAGLFMYKRLIEETEPGTSIHIFEQTDRLGQGMPYSKAGACREHITNVSANEIPELVTSVSDWLQTLSPDILSKYDIDLSTFHDYKVFPRLLFGSYLQDQFYLLKEKADMKGIETTVSFNTSVQDVVDENASVTVTDSSNTKLQFDAVVICTGHNWPCTHEGKTKGYFDSPYPPSKIALSLNHPVAIRGSSLTAIDAIRTLARHNGSFSGNGPLLQFNVSDESPNFKMVMHSTNGMLPGIRFHLEDSHLSADSLLTKEEINRNRKENDGFLELDFVFEQDFKEPLREKDPAFYEKIKDMKIEEFVELMMSMREKRDAFSLFIEEYQEAARSIRRRESVHWKEMLAVLSFAMNYPAKHFSAEDMLRLKKVLMPLISIVIAFVPQSSCEELIALHKAGKLDLVTVDEKSEVVPQQEGIIYKFIDDTGEAHEDAYKTFIDCIGQPPLSIDDFPFQSLVKQKRVIPATLPFRSSDEAEKIAKKNDKVKKHSDGTYHLDVPGIAINDNFQVLDETRKPNKRIFIMAVPYIGGYNPDYSGLDFCEEASGLIMEKLSLA